MNPPKFLFLSINEVCNLRCLHCTYWQSSLEPQTTLARRIEIVQELADLSPEANVVICGGEPMLDPSTYFEICRTSRRLNLRTLSVVNGTQIRNTEDALHVIEDGPDEISISLDHPTPEIHDRTRGVTGSHAAAVQALRLLLIARGHRAQPRIYAMGLLCRSTSLVLSDFYQFVLRDVGADKLKLNSLQPCFVQARLGQQVREDHFFASESQVDPDALRTSLAKCDTEYDLNLNPKWIEQVTSYFRGLQKVQNLERGWICGVNTTDHICDSAERNVMVDVAGRASLCFSEAFRGVQLTKPGDLRRFWETSDDVREEMRTCHRLCGISHSVRSSSATLERRT